MRLFFTKIISVPKEKLDFFEQTKVKPELLEKLKIIKRSSDGLIGAYMCWKSLEEGLVFKISSDSVIENLGYQIKELLNIPRARHLVFLVDSKFGKDVLNHLKNTVTNFDFDLNSCTHGLMLEMLQGANLKDLTCIELMKTGNFLQLGQIFMYDILIANHDRFDCLGNENFGNLILNDKGFFAIDSVPTQNYKIGEESKLTNLFLELKTKYLKQDDSLFLEFAEKVLLDFDKYFKVDKTLLLVNFCTDDIANIKKEHGEIITSILGEKYEEPAEDIDENQKEQLKAEIIEALTKDLAKRTYKLGITPQTVIQNAQHILAEIANDSLGGDLSFDLYHEIPVLSFNNEVNKDLFTQGAKQVLRDILLKQAEIMQLITTLDIPQLETEEENEILFRMKELILPHFKEILCEN